MGDLPVVPMCRTLSGCAVGQIKSIVLPIPPRREGRIAIVTKREAGLRWTRMCRETNGTFADGEVVWSRCPDAGAKFAGDVSHHADDGGKNARSPRRARRNPLKPFAQGMPDCLR